MLPVAFIVLSSMVKPFLRATLQNFKVLPCVAIFPQLAEMMVKGNTSKVRCVALNCVKIFCFEGRFEVVFYSEITKALGLSAKTSPRALKGFDVIITHFSNYKSKHGKFCAFSPKVYTIKNLEQADYVPVWSPGKTYKGDRASINANQVNYLVVDVDNDPEKGSDFVDISDIEEWMEDSELAGFVHTTKRHSPDCPRFRVIVPCDPIYKSQLEKETLRLIETLNLSDYIEMIDKKSYNAAQLWLYPCHLEGAPYFEREFVGNSWVPEEYNLYKAFAGVDLKTLDIKALLEEKKIKIGETSEGWTRCDCPFHQHQDSSMSAVFKHEEGNFPKIMCHAEKCSDKGLQDLLEYFGPDHFERRFKRNTEFKILNQQGNPKPVIENFEVLLNKIGVELYSDELLKDGFFVKDGVTEPINNYHYEYFINEAAKLDFNIRSCVKPMVMGVTTKQRRNIFAEWIKSEKLKDYTYPIDNLFETIEFDDDITEDQELFYRNIFRKWITSIVAVQFEPRPFTKGVLVLQGPQSIGKTSWIRRLLPPELEQYVNTGVTLDAQNKDSHKLAVSCAICELGELDATFKKTDISRMKSFITQTEDIIRAPYATAADRFMRRTIFCGSVNPKVFLSDDTGNSRWWVMPVKSLNIFHNVNMQQVYAEAYDSWLEDDKNSTTKSYLLTQEEEKQLASYITGFEKPLPYEEEIKDLFDWSTKPIYKVSINEIMDALWPNEHPVEPKKKYRVSKVLNDKLKFEQKILTLNKKKQRVYIAPALLEWKELEANKRSTQPIAAVN